MRTKGRNIFSVSAACVVARRMCAILPGLLVIGAATALAQVRIQAREADQFVDSMGINVHMESTILPYSSTNYAAINLTLQSLGMRHFRDEINAADASFAGHSLSSKFIKEIRSIGRLGYSLDGVIEGGNDYPPAGPLEASHVVPMIQSLLPTINAVEGPNEPDSTDSNGNYNFFYNGTVYPQGAINESEDLWNIVKKCSTDFPGPSISALPIVGMSEGNAADFTVLAAAWLAGNNPLPFSYATYGNMHAYQSGRVGDHRLAAWYIPYSRDLTLGDALWTTEMGYHNYTKYLSDGEQQGVSQRASAIYLPIAFLSGFDHGVLRTFSYELVDEANDPHLTSGSGEGHYGLLNYNLTPKPAYTALSNLISLIREPGGEGFNPGSLTVTFSGAPSTMRYTLLQKSTGVFYLALWNDISVYQVATLEPDGKVAPGKNLHPSNALVTLTFSTRQAFTVYAPNDSTGVNPTSAYTVSTTPESITLDLPPKVLLLEICP